MKNFRKIISKWQVILPIIMVFLVVSCYPGEDELVKKDYTGEELFRGIFFLQGEVANELESLRPNVDELQNSLKVDAKSKAHFNEFSDEIIRQINVLDPDYFNDFKMQMASDNYYAIELGLSNAKEMITAAGLSSEKYGGLFRLGLKLKEKDIDFSSKEFSDIDASTEEGEKKMKLLLKENYAIDVDDEEYQVACGPPAAGICVVYAIAGAVSIAVAAYTALAGVQAVAAFAYWVYNEVKFWGANGTPDNVASSDQLVAEITLLF